MVDVKEGSDERIAAAATSAGSRRVGVNFSGLQMAEAASEELRASSAAELEKYRLRWKSCS